MIHVQYTDCSNESFETLAEAQEGIEETILEIDFLTRVLDIRDDEGNKYGCTWSAKLEPLRKSNRTRRR